MITRLYKLILGDRKIWQRKEMEGPREQKRNGNKSKGRTVEIKNEK